MNKTNSTEELETLTRNTVELTSEAPYEKGSLGTGYSFYDTPRSVVFVLLFITALAMALRLTVFSRIGLWYDEACTVYLSEYASNPLQLFNPQFNNDPPLYLLIIYFWRQVMGMFHVIPGSYSFEYLLRLPSMLFSILTVPAAYFAGSNLLRLFPEETAARQDNAMSRDHKTLLFACFLIASSPLQLFYAHELRAYSLFALLGTLCLWAFCKALRDNKQSSWALLALCLTLGFWNHFYAAWFFICIDVFMVITWRSSKRYYRTWVFWHVVAGLACLPPLFIAYQTSVIVSQIRGQWIPGPTFKTMFITFKAFFAGYSPRAWAYWPIFFVTGALCCLGAWRLRNRPRNLVLLLIWTGLAMAASAFIWNLREFSYYEHRLFIWCGIPAAILAGVGWSRLPRILKLGCILTTVILTVPLLADTYAQRFHPMPQHRLGVRHKADNRTASAYISSHGASVEPILHTSHVTLPSFRIYLPAFPQKHIGLRQEDVEGFISAYPNRPLWENLDFVPVPLDALDLNIDSCWLVSSWWEPFERPVYFEEIEKRLKERFTETERRDFFAVTLIHFKRQKS